MPYANSRTTRTSTSRTELDRFTSFGVDQGVHDITRVTWRLLRDSRRPVRQVVLQGCMPELVHSTDGAQDASGPGVIKERHEANGGNAAGGVSVG